MFNICDIYPIIGSQIALSLNLKAPIISRQLDQNYFFIKTAAAIFENIKFASQEYFTTYIKALCRKHPYLQEELEGIYRILSNASDITLTVFVPESEYFFYLQSLTEQIAKKYSLTYNSNFVQNLNFLIFFSVSFNILTIDGEIVGVKNLRTGGCVIYILVFGSNTFCVYQQPFSIPNISLIQHQKLLCDHSIGAVFHNNRKTSCGTCRRELYNEEIIQLFRMNKKFNPQMVPGENLQLKINDQFDGEYNYSYDWVSYREKMNQFYQYFQNYNQKPESYCDQNSRDILKCCICEKMIIGEEMAKALFNPYGNANLCGKCRENHR